MTKEEIKNSEGLLAVMFSSPLCGPCKVMKPIAENLPIEIISSLEIWKYGTEFDFRDVPTFIVFNNGEEVNRIRGARGEKALEEFLKTNKII